MRRVQRQREQHHDRRHRRAHLHAGVPPPGSRFRFRSLSFFLSFLLCSQASAGSLLRRVLADQVQLTIQISDFKSNPPFAVVLYSASSRTPIGVPPQPTAFTYRPLTCRVCRVSCAYYLHALIGSGHELLGGSQVFALGRVDAKRGDLSPRLHRDLLFRIHILHVQPYDPNHERACVRVRPGNIGALTRVRTTAGQPGHEDRIAITFSYSTFTVGTSEQVVTFDWLSLICTPKFLVASITRNSRHTWHSRHT